LEDLVVDYGVQGKMCVLIGTIAFGVGGWIATYGWEVWFHEPNRGKRLRKGAWDLLRGTAVVALAGLLTTRGWNDISLAEQRRNLINAVVIEMAMNAQMLKQPPLEGDVYYLSEDQKLVLRPFPRLRTVALNAVLSSGVWDVCDPAERRLLDRVLEYENKVYTANDIFSGYNDYLLAKPDTSKAAEFGKTLQRGIPEKEFFKALTCVQSQLTTLIRNEYKWTIRTQELVGTDHIGSEHAQ
jgi:hypothetical protein